MDRRLRSRLPAAMHYSGLMAYRLALRVAAALLGVCLAAHAADPGKDLLLAARDGDLARIKELLKAGARVDYADKKGKTPLLLAAENGQADAVRLLLERGAHADARDKMGRTAYGLALFARNSEKRREATLSALPKPPRLRLLADSAWLPVNMVSSCFMSREEAAKTIGNIHLDAVVLAAVVDYARASGRDMVEFVNSGTEGLKPDMKDMKVPEGAGDAVVMLAVRPGASCSRGSDSLTLAIDVRVTPSGARSPILQETFGGGLKGLHAQTVNNPAQYPPFFEKWARSHADSIYWAVVRALLRAEP